MSFISVEFKKYNPIFKLVSYTIMDSDLGEIQICFKQPSNVGYEKVIAVAKAYRNRNLPVGRNLALEAIHTQISSGFNIKELVKSDDLYCSKYFTNWEQYAKERDEHLEKLLALI